VEEVDSKFVLEAFNLLRQSIISVEKDDVEVDDDEKPAVDGVAHSVLQQAQHEDDEDMEQRDAPQRQRTKVTYDRYMAILNLLVGRVNEEEKAGGAGVEHQELLVWYLEQRENEISNAAELEAEQSLAAKVLKRMVKDNILMQIRGDGEGLRDDDQEGSDDRIVYVLHPNCAVEEV